MAMGGVRVWVGLALWLGAVGVAQGVWPLPDAAQECSVVLYDRIFTPSLSQMKIPFALVQFFASWYATCTLLVATLIKVMPLQCFRATLRCNHVQSFQ